MHVLLCLLDMRRDTSFANPFINALQRIRNCAYYMTQGLPERAVRRLAVTGLAIQRVNKVATSRPSRSSWYFWI
ncbi:hypothetical protein HNY73_011275 [Argiope bruennichi]|uniref:Uncharacterized protein n=1 Tax=Argiope bruennichi TaxID=94029 RepID=A0A8T0F8M0_ARGBR|nr:hypothetical protein HNY73_011275 [Argiope bruennichi]